MDKTLESLREKFSYLHPLMFKRSCEKAMTYGELFDILSTIPAEFPIVWCDKEKTWKNTKDLLQAIKE